MHRCPPDAQAQPSRKKLAYLKYPSVMRFPAIPATRMRSASARTGACPYEPTRDSEIRGHEHRQEGKAAHAPPRVEIARMPARGQRSPCVDGPRPDKKAIRGDRQRQEYRMNS